MCTVFSRQLLCKHASKGSDLKIFQSQSDWHRMKSPWADIERQSILLTAEELLSQLCQNLGGRWVSFFSHFFQFQKLPILIISGLKTIPPASVLPPPRHRPSWPILSSSLCNSISVQVMMALISMGTLIRGPLAHWRFLRPPHIWHLACGERIRNIVAWWLKRKTAGIYCCQALVSRDLLGRFTDSNWLLPSTVGKEARVRDMSFSPLLAPLLLPLPPRVFWPPAWRGGCSQRSPQCWQGSPGLARKACLCRSDHPSRVIGRQILKWRE